MKNVAQENTPAASWHTISAETACERLQASERGLSSEEAQRRLSRYGPNQLAQARQRSALRRFFAQFNNMLLYVLLAASAVMALLGHYTDASVIFAVTVLNAFIGFIQEGKAEKALGAIRQMLSSNASVLRDGRRVSIPAADLVPGDVVLIEAGDKVPADLRLLRVRNLQAQEAALTGESVPVEKSESAVAEDAALGDRACLAYSGTLITAGQGTGLVVGTGADTEIGKISRMLEDVEPLETPLLRQIDRLARQITLALAVVALAVFAIGVGLRGYGFAETFIAVVSLAVAGIPEGLPAVLTITMAIGVQRMAGRQAIIRQLPAVETLGAVSIICSDKTGTLTRNEMTLRNIATSLGDFTLSGIGYAPKGEWQQEGSPLTGERLALAEEIARAMALCNDSALTYCEDGHWTVEGDPMEGALLAGAGKLGLSAADEHKALPRTDVIPFDAAHRFMATLHHNRQGQGFVYVKGAPERVLDMCARQRGTEGDGPLDRAFWESRIDALAGQGQRVLAVARRTAPHDHRELGFSDVEDGLTLLGLLGLIDPPREEAISAVHDCQQAGIRVKMITGDHSETARAIAAQLGLANSERVLTGHEVAELDDEELRRLALEVDVFARAAPEHKLRLVKALQAGGHVVAMTGDGVNDAPALKTADVGIAMGRKGTEAAKEAAKMVLADDNFASIDNAVREGRTVYDNLKKSIAFMLPINGGESAAIVAAILLGVTLPITPLQILWVNMVSSIGLALALAFEPMESDVMQRPPRPPREPILNGFLAWRVLLVSLLFLAGIFGVFNWALERGLPLEEARTLAVNTLVVMEVFYLFSVRYLGKTSLTWRGAMGTRAVLTSIVTVTVLQLIFTYTPVMAAIFESRPVAIGDGLVVIGVGVALFLILELEKLFRLKTGLGAAKPLVTREPHS